MACQFRCLKTQILCCVKARIALVFAGQARHSDCSTNKCWLFKYKHSHRSQENHGWKNYYAGGHDSRIAQLGATASDEQSVLDGRKAIDRR
jgi:hypothetical protein